MNLLAEEKQAQPNAVEEETVAWKKAEEATDNKAVEEKAEAAEKAITKATNASARRAASESVTKTAVAKEATEKINAENKNPKQDPVNKNEEVIYTKAP